MKIAWLHRDDKKKRMADFSFEVCVIVSCVFGAIVFSVLLVYMQQTRAIGERLQKALNAAARPPLMRPPRRPPRENEFRVIHKRTALIDGRF